MRQGSESTTENTPTMGRIGERPYWVLSLSLPIRAIHQVGAAVVLTAYLHDALPGPPALYLWIAVLSGGLLLLTEWMRHRQIFRELAGMITLVKMLLLGGAYHGFLPPLVTVLLAFLAASIGAHAPKKIRHKLLY